MNRLLIIFLSIIFINASAQVPYGLNSYIAPNNGCIFLDFDGHTITDPFWTTVNNRTVFICNPVNNMTTEQMIRVFNSVAEDFRPFTINVTTDSTKFFATSITKRVRVVITSTHEWYGNAGGVAFLESWRWGLSFGDIPCFVFSTLLAGNDKYVAECVSHEVGHTLGLFHQSRWRFINTDTCQFVDEYNIGRGSGEIGWSPIMGDSRFRNLTLWHNDKAWECTRFQDDIATITHPDNYITFRPDDAGDNQATANVVLNTNFSINGLINTTNDVDYYRFDFSKTGRFLVNAKPFSAGPRIYFSAFDPKDNTPNQAANLDLKLQLYRGNIFIAEYNPALKLDAIIDTILNAGIYYLVVSNTENANIYNYGMIGSYYIDGIYDGLSVLDYNGNHIYNINDVIKSIRIERNYITSEYYIYISNTDNINEIRIYNINGSLIEVINNIKTINTINLEKYKSGIYIINIGGIKTYKIIKI